MSTMLEGTALRVVVPQGNSKSMAKAMGCELHFAHYYLIPDQVLRNIVASELGITGTDFHRWREEYVHHLVAEDKWVDREWAQSWLAANAVTEDARRLVEYDMDTFSIDPNQVMGTELFLSVDGNFNPLEREEGGVPGRQSKHPDARYWGTLDLLLVNGLIARVVDAKSGWSTTTVSDDEPPFYAALVFAHFPRVEVVEFQWDFVRARGVKRASYTREDLPEIHDAMRRIEARKRSIAERFRRGEPLQLNPHTGLCSFCSLNCPVKQEVTNTHGIDVDIPPIQNDDDARRIAARLYVASLYASKARHMLKNFLDEKGSLELGNDWVCEIRHQTTVDYPLTKVAEILGLELVDKKVLAELIELLLLASDQNAELVARLRREVSPAWNVPIDKLALRTSKLNQYANTKKREGLLPLLKECGDAKPKSLVAVRHRGEGEFNSIEGGE